LQFFGDVETAWRANDAQLQSAGLDSTPRHNLLRTRAQLDLDAEMSKIDRLGARLVTRADSDYPDLLNNLPDAPGVLYVKGSLLPDDQRALALVGTRKATTYGKDVAQTFSRQLVERGITLVSGLAHGIDAVAHRTAIEAGGRTLAVLGCGIDIVYPADHRDLAREVTQHGALISEFPPGTRPEPRNFPRRNRLISGLSLGVLVIEAPEHSGAIITAGIAADQGREVFAVPGSVFSPMSRGTHRLIQDGAKLVADVSDILDEFDLAHTVAETQTAAKRIAPANEMEKRLLGCLAREPQHIDDLARLCEQPIAAVSSTLAMMELKGLARSVGPMHYSLPLEG
jgi:DNA processing protein